ncbi:MAG TPA: hypothetical protein VK437_06675 [Steroidobacteraceae bacterium]|nr:hypothetical protein [Steroidobacteraceae bacterium]
MSSRGGETSATVGASSAPEDQFSFSSQAAKDEQEKAAAATQRAEAIRSLVAVPCQERIKNQKIVVLIGEHTSDQWDTSQDRYGPLFRIIDGRLRALGLKTYTQGEIKASIAQAEVAAYFNNDPDGALSASKRLGANYVLRGSISGRSGVNPVVQVNEVAVNITLTLEGIDGRLLSEVHAHADSYSGSDTLATALTLVREQADPLVAQLYNDFCRAAASQE